VVAGTTTVFTLAGGMDRDVKARLTNCWIERLVWTFRSPAAIHVSSTLGFWANSFWNWRSAETSSMPWFCERLRSPSGVSWRLRENERACFPFTPCRPALTSAPMYGRVDPDDVDRVGTLAGDALPRPRVRPEGQDEDGLVPGERREVGDLVWVCQPEDHRGGGRRSRRRAVRVRARGEHGSRDPR